MLRCDKNVCIFKIQSVYWTSSNTQKHRSIMLEYAKVILPKVSFSRELFEKELKKCINWVSGKELEELRSWCYKQFENIYPDILLRSFDHVAA